MGKLLRRLTAAGVGTALGLVVAFTPAFTPAFAEQVATGVGMDQEAWYYHDPAQPAPWDSLREAMPEITGPAREGTREATNPYVTDTLHVGVRAGQPEAYTFVSFPLLELSATGLPVVTGGTVTLQASGLHEQRAADAEMVACLVLQPVNAEQAGDWEAQPDFDCNVRSPAVLEEGSDPLTWTVDLVPFAGAWSEPTQNFGIALVPDPHSDAPPPAQTWHVAFHAGAYEPETPAEPEPRPITADLRYVVDEIEPPALGEVGELSTPPPAPPAPSPGFAPVTPAPAEVGPPEVDAADPSVAEPEPVDVDDAVPVAETVPLQPVTQTDPSGPMSLLALVCAGLFGYALTSEGTLRLRARPALADAEADAA